MRTRLLLTITVAMAAVVMPTTHAATAAPPSQPLPPNPTTVHEWLTTPGVTTPTDTQLPLLNTVTATPVAVHVDPNVRYQSVSGVGAAITDSAAHVLYGLTPDNRDQVMRNLFDPKTGAGLSFLRQPIGASDFVAGPDYSYDDVPAGQTDYQMRQFTIAHDQAQILPLLRQAKKINPKIQIVASPWSPPAWMKTGGSMIDGKLIDDPRIYRAYALYLVKFIQAYQQAGVPVDYLTVQNEPQALERKNYPGTDLPWVQEAKVISALGPAIRAAGLRTKILAYDHNWSVHPGDISSYQRANEDPQPNYPYDLLGTDASEWIAGTAYHCYAGNSTAQTGLKAAFPDKDIFMTECEGGSSSTVIGVMQNWGRASIDWNIALDENHSPHLGGCGSCNGTVTVNSVTKAVTYNDQYRDLSHFGRFVPGGAVHIASTVDSTFGTPKPTLTTVAFTNPDHSTVLVALNNGATAQDFTVVYGTHSFVTSLPAGSTVTFQWGRIH